jgi:hypothetical protein
LGGYLLILVLNALAAALSFMGRTRQQRFPLGRCILAAAGPSTLPVLLPIALVWSDRGGDGASLAVVLALCLSFWVSGAIERRLPRSRSTASLAAVFSPPLPKRKAVDCEATGSPLWDPDVDSPPTR